MSDPVVRYIHIRPRVKRRGKWVTTPKGGATVRIVGDLNKVGTVEVQYALCSKDDLFCKETGRVHAAKAEALPLPLRYLGGALTHIAEDVDSRCGMTEDTDYNWAIKYFLPKA